MISKRTSAVGSSKTYKCYEKLETSNCSQLLAALNGSERVTTGKAIPEHRIAGVRLQVT
jgi:hypothetical protein